MEPNAVGNFFVKRMINSPLHARLGRNLAVITVVERRTGRHYSIVIGLAREDGEMTAVSHRVDRTWWRNLRDGRMAKLREGDSRASLSARI